jgi:uncharacterized alpha/beta hydrolase family protein
MKIKNKLYIITIILLITFIASALISNVSLHFFTVHAQTSSADNDSSIKPLPVILIRGYLSDASVWNKWKDLLKKDNISAFPITFNQSDDRCGSAVDHAKELSSQIVLIKNKTGQSKVNIVGHSKGGLDARVYLANGAHDIANLIMIGTPNSGSILAQNNNFCTPAIYDLKPDAVDTKVKMNPNTKYYTIAGDWNPDSGNCDLSLFSFMEHGTSYALSKPNDGLVPVSSVESLGYAHNLGHSKSCHTNLLSDYEYGLSKDILLGKK